MIFSNGSGLRIRAAWSDRQKFYGATDGLDHYHNVSEMLVNCVSIMIVDMVDVARKQAESSKKNDGWHQHVHFQMLQVLHSYGRWEANITYTEHMDEDDLLTELTTNA